MSHTGNQNAGSLKETAGVVFEPFADFMAGLQSISKPEVLGEYILSGQATAPRVAKFLISSIVISSLIQAVLPSKDNIQVSLYPVVDEVLMLLIWLAIAFVTTALYYIPLKMFNGKGTFIQTVKASAYITAAYQPLFVLLDGVATKITGEPLPPAATAGAIGMIYFATLAYIDKLSKMKVFWIVNLGTLVSLGLLFGLFVGVYSFVNANGMLPESAYEPLTPVQVAGGVEPALLAQWKKNPQTQNLSVKQIIFTENDGKVYKGWADVTDGINVERFNLEATVTSRKTGSLSFKLTEIPK